MGQSYLSRRQFIAAGGAAFAAATGLTIDQAMAQKGFRLGGKSSLVQGGGGEDGARSTLTPDDITFKGYIRYASSGAMGDLTFSQGATCLRKMPNGDLHVLMAGRWSYGAENEPLLEFDITGLTPTLNKSSAPRAPLVRNWGTFAENNYTLAGDAKGANKKYIGGLLVDPNDHTKVWWSYGDSYFSSQWGNYPTLGCTILNDAAGTYQSYGPWNYNGFGGQLMRGPLFEIPADWASANGLGSKTIGISAGASAGAAGIPYGCNGHAFAPFDPATKEPDWYTDVTGSIDFKTLILHRQTTKQARNTRYKHCGLGTGYSCADGTNPFLEPGTPEWGGPDTSASVSDSISGVQIVRTATKEGMVFVGHLAMGPTGWTPDADSVDSDGHPHQGYAGSDVSGTVPPQYCCHMLKDPYWNATGPYCTYRNWVMWIYPLSQISEVIAGSRLVNGCVPTTDAYEVGYKNVDFQRRWRADGMGRLLVDNTTSTMYSAIKPAQTFDVIGAFSWPILGVWEIAA